MHRRSPMAKNVGILGSGMVAQALGTGFLKRGFSVKFGTRDPAKLADFVKKAGDGATIGSFSDAAAFGNLIVLAIKGKHAKEALALAGHASLNGKTVIDATNPIDDVPPVNGVLKFFSTLDRSPAPMAGTVRIPALRSNRRFPVGPCSGTWQGTVSVRARL